MDYPPSGAIFTPFLGFFDWIPMGKQPNCIEKTASPHWERFSPQIRVKSGFLTQNPHWIPVKLGTPPRERFSPQIRGFGGGVERFSPQIRVKSGFLTQNPHWIPVKPGFRVPPCWGGGSLSNEHFRQYMTFCVFGLRVHPFSGF
jgi:hypothetical protein